MSTTTRQFLVRVVVLCLLTIGIANLVVLDRAGASPSSDGEAVVKSWHAFGNETDLAAAGGRFHSGAVYESVVVKPMPGEARVRGIGSFSNSDKRIKLPLVIGRTPTPGPGAPDQIIYSYRNAHVGTGDIHSIRTDGTGLTILTHSPAIDLFPRWSPDRRQIAFTRLPPSDGSQLMVMNADGSDIRVILTPGVEYASGASWSPDGTSLVFANNDPNEDGIYRIGLDGSNMTNLTADLIGDVYSPDWSPDGTRIAFGYSKSSDQSDIWLMNPDGSGKTNLTNDGTLKSNPRWSPDGSQILFNLFDDADEGGPILGGMNVMPAGGGASTRVVNKAFDGAWSPDGTQIVFDTGPDGVFRSDADGQNVLPVIDSDLASHPDW